MSGDKNRKDLVYVDDLDIPVDRLTEGAKRVMDRGMEESRHRQHSLVTSVFPMQFGMKKLGIVRPPVSGEASA